jgi:hypothetical protein
MNMRRKNIVTLAFKRLDKNGNNSIELEDIKGTYNAANHPDVKMGKKTQDEVLYDFLDTFEQHYALAVSLLFVYVFRTLLLVTSR